MAEYIDIDAQVVVTDTRGCEYETTVRHIFEMNKGVYTAADVRPVVLCRDCKYAPIGDKDGNDLEWPFDDLEANPCPCKCMDNWYSYKPMPKFYCAAGVKREKS